MRKIDCILLFLIIIFLQPVSRVFAQDYKKPELVKNKFKPNKYDGIIEYHFPDTVSSVISSYINRVNDADFDFFIELIVDNDAYKLIMYQHKVGDDIDTNSPLEIILSSTNRYCLIDKKIIPIYFKSDLEFGYFNFSITGTALVINIERKSFRNLKVSSISISD